MPRLMEILQGGAYVLLLVGSQDHVTVVGDMIYNTISAELESIGSKYIVLG